LRKALLLLQAMPKALEAYEAMDVPVPYSGAITCGWIFLNCVCRAQPSVRRRNNRPEVSIKSGIAVGTANTFLSAAYTLSPVVVGAVVEKARACMCEAGVQLLLCRYDAHARAALQPSPHKLQHPPVQNCW
jgi:hypothetical protein